MSSLVRLVARPGLVTGLILLTACASSSAHTQTTDLTASKADVRVTSFDTPAVLRRGQTLGIHPPVSIDGEWQVDYDQESIRLMTPVADLAKPGTRGWVWQAIKAGQSDVVFTSVARCAVVPCAPNVMRFTLKIEIKPEGQR